MSLRAKSIAFSVLILLLPVFLIGKYMLENHSAPNNDSSLKSTSISLKTASSVTNQCQVALKQMDGTAYNNPAALAKLSQASIAPIVYQVNTDIHDELSLNEVNQYITLQNQYLADQYQGKSSLLPSGCKPDQPAPPTLPLISNYYPGYVYKD